MSRPKTVLITGASSGIGEALALAYAGHGRSLFLSGRDQARLQDVVERCRQRGAQVMSAAVDVADREAMAEWIQAADQQAPIDLAVANAGISAGSSGKGESAEQARDVFATNLAGVLNTVHPALAAMGTRRRGQIALMSSMAAFLPLSGAPAYASSKAAVLSYGLALRADAAALGVGVSVICPGFVKSRITDMNRFPMPFLMDAERAARIIEAGLARDRALIAFPWQMRLTVGVLAALPMPLRLWVTNRMPRKSAR